MRRPGDLETLVAHLDRSGKSGRSEGCQGDIGDHWVLAPQLLWIRPAVASTCILIAALEVLCLGSFNSRGGLETRCKAEPLAAVKRRRPPLAKQVCPCPSTCHRGKLRAKVLEVVVCG